MGRGCLRMCLCVNMCVNMYVHGTLLCPCVRNIWATLLNCFQIGGPSVLYVVYRLGVTTFFCVSIIYSIVNSIDTTHWPFYMSHWTFILITLNTILQAICVTRHYVIFKQDELEAGNSAVFANDVTPYHEYALGSSHPGASRT